MIKLMMVGFYSIGIDASPGIGCLALCSPVPLKYDTPSDKGIPEISTS